jgi:archaeosine synthase beta-subunit
MTASPLPLYPDDPLARDRWIVAQRGQRAPVTAEKPYAFLTEQERFADGSLGEVATIFLTNRECPWRCVMCDLWRNTLPYPVKEGNIPGQIAYALERLPAARQVKLYNSGSFFDRGAIPERDYAAIAALLRDFERVIIECHPSLVTENCQQFRDLLRGDLEIAMGLETAHPEVLAKLNKRMTLPQYAAAADRLRTWRIGLRSFVLLQPPFMGGEDAFRWAARSIDFAQDCGATVVALIPTRDGNGAMEALAAAGQFASPKLSLMEESLAYGISRRRGRVFLDLWDFERFAVCEGCREGRRTRLQRMNLSQSMELPITCERCTEPQ